MINKGIVRVSAFRSHTFRWHFGSPMLEGNDVAFGWFGTRSGLR